MLYFYWWCKVIIGSHVSFKSDGLLGSTKEAISYGANTFMFYTGAPQNTNRLPLNDALTKVKGVASCEVSLKNKNAIVFLNKNVTDKTLKNAVEKVGYKVVSIETK